MKWLRWAQAWWVMRWLRWAQAWWGKEAWGRMEAWWGMVVALVARVRDGNVPYLLGPLALLPVARMVIEPAFLGAIVRFAALEAGLDLATLIAEETVAHHLFEQMIEGCRWSHCHESDGGSDRDWSSCTMNIAYDILAWL